MKEAEEILSVGPMVITQKGQISFTIVCTTERTIEALNKIL